MKRATYANGPVVMVWEFLHEGMTPEHLGYIPSFLSTADARPAKEQIDAHYGHGGGWRSFKGFTLEHDNSLKHPGDPPLKPLAKTKLRDEMILLYRHCWVCIVQPDRTFEVARID